MATHFNAKDKFRKKEETKKLKSVFSTLKFGKAFQLKFKI